MSETPQPARRRIVVLTAPSGAGKTTIARRVMDALPEMRFSVSATTRPPRPHEQHGVHYFFVSEAQFRQHIADGDLLEYEEVYPGRLYGTLRREVERAAGEAPLLLDIDVKGAVNVKDHFGDDALTLFIQPPSLQTLAERLQGRQTESDEMLRIRLDTATRELAMADRFDAIVVNDDLEAAVAETLAHLRAFLGQEG